MNLPQLMIVLLSVSFLVFLPSPTANAATFPWQFCGSSGNFVDNSTYELNLQTLLKNLTTGATNSTSNFGFARTIIGSIPNQISGIVLCRGDINYTECSSCISQATQDIQNLCAYYKDATIYYDYCLLRFSNQDFLSSEDNSDSQIILHNTHNMTVPFAAFNNLATYLINSTADYAAFNNTKKFGTSVMNLTNPFSVIWGLAQCTRDMSGSTCRSCLQDLISQMLKYFNGRQGGRILGVRCNFRYENYSFYEGTTLLTVAPQFNINNLVPAPALVSSQAPAPTVTPAAMINSGPQGKKKTSTGTILAISIPLVLVFIAIASIYVCFLKRRKSAPRNPLMSKKKTSTGKVLKNSIPLVLAFIAIAGLYVCFLKRRKYALTKPLMNIGDTEEIKSVESLFLSISVLRVATINFAEENKLGEGGFGVVYKGVLPDGREIAVKRLSERSSQGLYELKNELLLLAKLQHKNLVRLLGVCLEGKEKMLVYEYIRNKSLDQILFDTEKQHLLDWGRRYKIICGIARGLLYLHEDSQLRIIHRDLKASNVLLDEGMNPKISDFGMARLFLEDQTQAVTRHVVGTFGYIAPEYAAHGHFSIKSDVFSYGVLLLEIITGKKNNCTFENEDIEGLLNFVWKHWADGTITEVADPLLGQQYSTSELLRCAQIALLCVQDNPTDIPTMSNVVVMLSSETMSLQVWKHWADGTITEVADPLLGQQYSTSELLRCAQIALLCVQDNPTDRPTMSNVVVMLSSETVSLHAPFRPVFCIASSGMHAYSFQSGFNNSQGITDRSSSKSIPTSQNEVSITDIEPR